jgi:hypothetical protein
MQDPAEESEVDAVPPAPVKRPWTLTPDWYVNTVASCQPTVPEEAPDWYAHSLGAQCLARM